MSDPDREDFTLGREVAEVLAHPEIATASPLCLFESVDNYLKQISFRIVSAEALAAAIEPYVNKNELFLDQCIDNSKYIKTAYLLGVRRFRPRFQGDNLAIAIYESDTINSMEKQYLFEWLLEQNYFTTNPLPLKTIFKWLIEGRDLSFGCFIRRFPVDVDQIDGYYTVSLRPLNNKNKCNIVHAAVYNGGLLKIWKSFRRIYSAEELVQMLLEFNEHERMALDMIILSYCNNSYRAPKEVVLTMILIAQTCNFDLLNKVTSISKLQKSSIFAIMYKYGMTPDKVPPILPGHAPHYYQLPNNPFVVAHRTYHFKEQLNSDRTNSEEISNCSVTFPIEMLHETTLAIAEYLDLTGVISLFTMSRNMTPYMKMKNDQLWRQIYRQNIYTLDKIHNCKAMAIQYERSAVNWISRNFDKIHVKLDGIKASSVMDENWLVLSNKENVYLWDCHAHQSYWICEVPFTDRRDFKPIKVLGGIYNGECPPVIINYHNTSVFGLAYNGVFKRLHNWPTSDVLQPSQVDVNLLLFPNGKLYDVLSDSVVGDSISSTKGSVIFNPFNRTYVNIMSDCCEIFDMNHQSLKRLTRSKGFSPIDAHRYEFLNEFTMMAYPTIGDVQKVILIEICGDHLVEQLIQVPYSEDTTFIVPNPPKRIILADDRTGLVTICHLPSMQWQAVYHLQATVTAANSRYLVGNENGNAVIYDFCK